MGGAPATLVRTNRPVGRCERDKREGEPITGRAKQVTGQRCIRGVVESHGARLRGGAGEPGDSSGGGCCETVRTTLGWTRGTLWCGGC